MSNPQSNCIGDMVSRLLLKVERVRRLYESSLLALPVERGEDGTFGLGLTEENELAHIYDAADPALRLGDQVREVSSADPHNTLKWSQRAQLSIAAATSLSAPDKSVLSELGEGAGAGSEARDQALAADDPSIAACETGGATSDMGRCRLDSASAAGAVAPTQGAAVAGPPPACVIELACESGGGARRVPVVRERLADVIARQFNADPAVTLHVSRTLPTADKRAMQGADVFAVARLLTDGGAVLVEYSTDLWTARENAVWGSFWTVPLPSNAASVWLGLYRSNFFTEPLVGFTEFRLRRGAAESEGTDTRWHALVAEGECVATARSTVGEMLLTVRRFADHSSVSPLNRPAFDSDDSEDDTPSSNLPPNHAAVAIKPVIE